MLKVAHLPTEDADSADGVLIAQHRNDKHASITRDRLNLASVIATVGENISDVLDLAIDYCHREGMVSRHRPRIGSIC